MRHDERDSKAKMDFVQQQTQSMGNNGDEGQEKMWEENGIMGNENVKVI